MKLRNMFLGNSAVLNADNTFSVLKGGINALNMPFHKKPDGTNAYVIPPMHLSLVATIELEVTEMGRLHNLEVSLLDADGGRTLPDLKSHFQTPASHRKGYHNVLLDMTLPFKKPGEYAFYINVDGHELGYHPLYVNIVEMKKA